MTATLDELQATEARLKANGWTEANLRWWRRSAYTEAGLAVPQPVASTRSGVTATVRPETGGEWARRLTGKAKAEPPAADTLAARAIQFGYGRQKDQRGADVPGPHFIGVEER